MKILVLGSGCKKCMELEKNTTQALKELNIDEKVTHIANFVEIAKYGIMSTPALVLDNKVVSTGKVLSVEEIKSLLQL